MGIGGGGGHYNIISVMPFFYGGRLHSSQPSTRGRVNLGQPMGGLRSL